MTAVPFELTPIDAYPTKQAWDASATDLVATMLRRWNLTALGAFAGGEAGSVLEVTTAGGRPAVLKVAFPHVEGVWEAVALEAWHPLAPEVLRQDPWTWSLLLERVEPGIPLSRAVLPAARAVSVGARLLRDLGATEPPDGLPTLDEVMRPMLDKAVVASDAAAEGLDVFSELLEVPGDAFLHGDFNPGNVVQSGGGWAVIDPKPMVGDAAFDVWPLVSQLGAVWSDPHPEAVLEAQLESACEIAGIDVARAARWSLARSALNVSWFRADGDARAEAAAERETAAWRAVSAP